MELDFKSILVIINKKVYLNKGWQKPYIYTLKWVDNDDFIRPTNKLAAMGWSHLNEINLMYNYSIFDFCLYLIFFIVSVCVLFEHLKLFVNYFYLKNYGVRTIGVVTSLNKTKGENGETLNKPTITFSDKNNNSLEVGFPFSYNTIIMNIEIGKEFKLIYDEEKPENYIIDDLMFFILPLITVLVMLSVLINSINNLILYCSFF